LLLDARAGLRAERKGLIASSQGAVSAAKEDVDKCSWQVPKPKAIRSKPMSWAAQYKTWLFIELTPKGVGFYFLF